MPKVKPQYSMEEVRTHNKEGDMWIVIDRRVYDVSKYFPYHPGGAIMKSFAGRDATDPFVAWHDEVVEKKLKTFEIGVLDTINEPLSEYEQDKRNLVLAVREAGYFKNNWPRYSVTLVMPLLFFAVGLYILFNFDSLRAHVISSLFIAFFWHQSAFVGHDVMHNSVLKGRNAAHWLGLIYGNLMTGISGGWWKLTHNMHHATVNEWDTDPDITHLPIFAVTERMFLAAEARPLTAVEEVLLKVLVAFQHITYFPIMLFARFNLYLQGILMMVTGRVPTMPYQKVHFDRALQIGECLSLAGFWAWYVALVYYALYVPYGWRHAVYFVMAGHLYMGVLHIQITLSHWERPMASKDEADKNTHGYEWFRTQIETGRNINPNWWNNFYFGGLNMQIEHHLFPRVTRHNLPAVKELVLPFCEKWGISYCSTGFAEAVVDVVSSLGDVSRQVHLYEDRKQAREAAQKKATKSD